MSTCIHVANLGFGQTSFHWDGKKCWLSTSSPDSALHLQEFHLHEMDFITELMATTKKAVSVFQVVLQMSLCLLIDLALTSSLFINCKSFYSLQVFSYYILDVWNVCLHSTPCVGYFNRAKLNHELPK